MRSIRLIRGAAVAVALAISLAVAGCGGGPASANDPAGAVTSALSAVSGGGIAKIADYACAAHKNDIANAFGGANFTALESAGIKADDIMNAMSISFANVKTSEVSKTDTAAKVHVTADMTISFDKEKFKTIMKTMMTAQGLPADDATIDAAVTAMSAQLSQSQKLDEDIDVVNEGGKWLICD